MVLAGAVGLTLWAGWYRTAQPVIAAGTLAKALPLRIGDWVGQDVPLGETEAVKAAVATLDYDDYVYRVYRQGQESIFVYAMHWRQGRISVREMSGHTPDGCWIANGARWIGAPTQQPFKIGPRWTAPAEVRTFRFPGGAAVNAAWWHIWGGTVIPRSFASKTLLPMVAELRLWLGQHRGHADDQWLVRLHSDRALSEVLQSEVAVEFLAHLPTVFDAQKLDQKPSG